MNDNPYAAPLTTQMPADLAVQPYFTDGTDLVVVSGAVLPLYCVKTNEPITPEDLVHKKFYWCTPWVLLTFLFAGLLTLILYFVFRRRCDLTYGLHPAVRGKGRRRLLTKAAVVGLLLLAIALAVSFKSPAPAGVATVLFFVSLIVLLLGNAPLSVRKAKRGQFWIKGCSPEFLARLAALPPATLPR